MGNIRFDDVWKIYPDGTEAVKQLELEVADGEFVILVGPSGCGKSTALRTVAGLEEISRGEMYIGERLVNDLTPKERDIAMVFQSYALYPHMSVADNMGFALKLAKVEKSEIEKRVREAARILDLTDYLDRKPKALSGGQRQRVAMGRAIVRDPQAFLMDEPLSNLDAKLRVAMRAEIAALQTRLGVTTLYVTHDQVEAMTMGDRVAVLSKGELMQAAEPQTLYDTPANLFVASFIGSPAMNLARGTIQRDSSDRWQVSLGGITLDIADKALTAYPRVRDYEGREVAVGLRPEHFFRGSEIPEGKALPTRRVDLVEVLGAEMLVHFDTKAPAVMVSTEDQEGEPDPTTEELTAGMARFTARLDPQNAPKIGDSVDLGFHTEKLHFFDLNNGATLS